MIRLRALLLALVLWTSAGLPLETTRSAVPPSTVRVKLIAFNDFHGHPDEATIEARTRNGDDFKGVGTPGFDGGIAEPNRKKAGACSWTLPAAVPLRRQPCQAQHPYSGARFAFLAANVVENGTGARLFPA